MLYMLSPLADKSLIEEKLMSLIGRYSTSLRYDGIIH